MPSNDGGVDGASATIVIRHFRTSLLRAPSLSGSFTTIASVHSTTRSTHIPLGTDLVQSERLRIPGGDTLK